MIKIIKNTIRYISPFAALLTIPAAAMAANIAIPKALEKTADITTIITGIIRFILITAFVIAFIMLLVGGIRWIIAGGDEKAVEKARNTITAALIGLVVVLVAFALIKLVETFFGISIISNLAVPFINTGTTGPTE